MAQYADFVEEGTSRGKLFDLGAYPAAVPSDNPSEVVRGEVYLLDDPEPILKFLDEYEGCSGENPLYRRQKIQVVLENGKKVYAWIYMYSQPMNGFSVIPSGDYLKFKEINRYES